MSAMTRLLGWLVAGALLASEGAWAGPRLQDLPETTFEELAEAARETYGLSEASPSSETLDAWLHGSEFLRLPLGAIELFVPSAAVQDRDSVKRFGEISQDVLEMQKHWVDWTVPSAKRTEELQDQLERLAKWVKGLSQSKWKRAREAEGDDLMVKTGAKEEVLLARDELHRALTVFEDSQGKDVVRPARIILASTRKDFLDYAAFVGWAEPLRREALWHESTWRGTAVWGSDVQIVALVYAAWPFDAEHPFQGSSFDSLKAGSFQQHTIDRAAASLLRRKFFEFASPIVETALNTNLVIATCGENDLTFGVSSFSWSRAGGKTRAYSRFVPGGNSAGGTLPKRTAYGGPTLYDAPREPKWRKTKGEDYFKRPLKDGQADGFKLAAKDRTRDDEARKDKRRHFEILPEKGNTGFVISAPFLGAPSENKEVPPFEFLDDYEEFYRAYKSCFFEWLRTEGGADPEESKQHFAEWIRRVSMRKGQETYDELAAEVYGQALSSREPSESLEWTYLAWLGGRR